MKMTAFTVPYFRLTDGPPPVDFAPLFSSGLFGIKGISKKYIREEKFTLSWSGGVSANDPSLMVVLNPLTSYRMFREKHYQTLSWVRNNIFYIRSKWEEVLDLLDEQTTLPVR